ncbi:MAG: HD domain-containing protein, partial [Nitrososphaerales archaeon]
MVIAEHRGLNSNKAVKMALLHDLAESITGDYMPDDLTREMKSDREMEAMKDILSKLPPKMRANFGKLWNEYKSMSSKEAMLVRQVDKLEMALQASDYARKGYDVELLSQFFLSAEEGIKDKELLHLLNALKSAKR